MGKDSQIEWTHHTFNPWMGCTKVSQACVNCYAERDMDHRFGKVAWGPKGSRIITSDANWRKPLRWNLEAMETGQRFRVFCASLADVFEDWTGPMMKGGSVQPETTMQDVRKQLFRLIDITPNLDWLLLTKRPENIWTMLPDNKRFRHNLWLGTSVENQEVAAQRIHSLTRFRYRASVLFLSCEPLLGELRLDNITIPMGRYIGRWNCLDGLIQEIGPEESNQVKCETNHQIDWVIAGGESGPNARPMAPKWARSLQQQCESSGVPFLFKQWGEWLHMSQFKPGSHDLVGIETTGQPNSFFAKVGKKRAGRLLDGQAYDQYPQPRTEFSANTCPSVSWTVEDNLDTQLEKKSHHRDPENRECTRDPIFLFQKGVRQWVEIPYGLESNGDGLNVVEGTEPGELDDWVRPFIDDEGNVLTNDEFWELAEKEEGINGWPFVYIEWHTECVFLNREDAEQYANSISYRLDHWRVDCVPCDEKLAAILNASSNWADVIPVEVTDEVGPVYSQALIKCLPFGTGGMLQAMPDRKDLDQVKRINERTVAGYELLLNHFLRLQNQLDS